jgi:hypothetical protein
MGWHSQWATGVTGQRASGWHSQRRTSAPTMLGGEAGAVEAAAWLGGSGSAWWQRRLVLVVVAASGSDGR